MDNDFLSSLYKEEESIIKKIASSSLYEDLLEVQRLIIKRGGNPKQLFGIKSLNPQETLFSYETYVPKPNAEEYSTKWTWLKKTEFAFNFFGGRSSPKHVINILTTLEGKDVNDKISRLKVAANVYNILSALRENGNIIKDESVKDEVVYILTNEQSQLEDLES